MIIQIIMKLIFQFFLFIVKFDFFIKYSQVSNENRHNAI